MNTELLKRWISKNGPNGLIRLAAESEINPATINKILRGSNPSVDTAKKLARTLGVSLDDLCNFPKSKHKAA